MSLIQGALSRTATTATDMDTTMITYTPFEAFLVNAASMTGLLILAVLVATAAVWIEEGHR